jgi:hypothetical protein
MVKLNLLVNNPGGVRSGYVNVDPVAPEGNSDRIACPLEKLDATCDAAEAEELVALDILDLFPAKVADAVLDHWLSRLAHGGKITLSVVDMMEVARGFTARSLSIEDANLLLHGNQSQPWEFRKATYYLPMVVNTLTSKGYKILTKKISNYRAVITAERP